LYCTLPFFSYKYVLTKYYSGDQIKKNEIGCACGMCGEEARCIQVVGWEPKGIHGHGWEDGSLRYGTGAWIGLMWLRDWTGGRLL